MYKFENLNRKMDTWGFPKIDYHSGFKVIRVDFEEAYKNGKITFKEDGIYLEYENKEYRGYMFIKEPYIERYGKYPKFHLTKCQVIQQFIDEGLFRQRYEWSNSNINDLIDITSGNIYEKQVLNYCKYCRNQLFDDIHTTEDFFKTLNTTDIEESTTEVDIFGYVKGWQKISREYQKSRDYKCEYCGIVLKNGNEKMYLHTHHVNGDKTNNRMHNLKCLCILCHSYSDKQHIENFEKPRMQKSLKFFIKTFRSRLLEVKNPYLVQYDRDNIEEIN